MLLSFLKIQNINPKSKLQVICYSLSIPGKLQTPNLKLQTSNLFMSELNYSIITIKVGLNEQGLPEDIQWKATGSGMENINYSKAFLLSVWDRKESTTFRVDLWTKDMLVDE